LLGDNGVGQEALLRFYVLHVVVLPLVVTLLVAVHFWRIRKDGGLSRPVEADETPEFTPQPVAAFAPVSVPVAASVAVSAGGAAAAPALAPAAVAGAAVVAKPALVRRSYGIQGLVRGPFTKIGNVPDNTEFSWPNLLQAELLVLLVTLACILIVSVLFNAPLEEPVNVMHPPNPAKAPWYFLGLQEMVSYSAFWGGVGIPTIEVIVLLLVPYLDRKTVGVGRWFARERLLANSIFLTFVVINVVLMVIGTFFRGPNWEFVSPW
jgi:quinol-cytochrome oxidoreductase complex cytochrome b subunit